jgi:hypothetical protein
VKANPFVQMPGGNNSFTPQKIGAKPQVCTIIHNFRIINHYL